MSNPQREIANFLAYNEEQLKEIKESNPTLSKAINSVVNALVTKYADVKGVNEYVLLWSEMWDKTDQFYEYIEEMSLRLQQFAKDYDVNVSGDSGYIKNKIMIRLNSDDDESKETTFRVDIGSGGDWEIFKQPLQAYIQQNVLGRGDYKDYLKIGQNLDFNSIVEKLKDSKSSIRQPKYNFYCNIGDEYFTCSPALTGYEFGSNSYWSKKLGLTPVFTMSLKKIDYVELVDKKINKIVTYDEYPNDVQYVIPFEYSEIVLDKISSLQKEDAVDILGQRVQQYEHIKDTSGNFNTNSFGNDYMAFYSPKEGINIAFIGETALLRDVNTKNVDDDKTDNKSTSDDKVDVHPIWLPDPAKNTGNRNGPTQSAKSYFDEINDIIPDLTEKLKKAQDVDMAILRVQGNDGNYFTLRVDKNNVVKWRKTNRSEDEITDYITTLPDDKKDQTDNKSKKELEKMLKEKKEALAYFEPSDQEYVDLELEIDDIEEQLEKLN